MRVVINNCFGGFSISEKCADRLEELGYTGSIRRSEWGVSISDYENENAVRSNPLLVQAVEELGKAANGNCARLKIIDIPFDGVQGWHIHEYDGMESIRENHGSWS